MKHWISALAALTVSLPAAVATAGVYAPPQADFAVVLPGDPAVEAEGQGDPEAPEHRSYTTVTAGIRYDVTIDRYPRGIRAPAPTRAIYERLLWAHAQDAQMEFVAMRPATLSGLPCFEASYSDPKGGREIRRILMVGDSIYQLSYRLQDEAADAALSGDFFSSFRITASSLTQARAGSGSAI